MEEKGKKIGKGNPPKNTQFKKWQKPPATWAQKSAGRERRRQAQQIMDKMLRYSEMTVEDLENEIKTKGKKMSVQDYLITKYVTSGTKSEKMLVDWMDRHIAKAPTQMEIDQNINMTAKVVSLPELDDAGNSPTT